MPWEATTKKLTLSETNAFAFAHREVTFKAGRVDGFLINGGLNLESSANMLQQATGMSVYDEDSWNVDQVKELARRANWNFTYSTEDKAGYWSARYFLNTCAKLGLGIGFSW